MPRGRTTALISATGHRFDTLGATSVTLDCADGAIVQSRLRVAPASAEIKKSIMSAGEVADSDNVVVFHKTGGELVSQKSGRRITFPRQGGV